MMTIIRIILRILSILLVGPVLSHAQAIQTIMLDFSRTVLQEDREEKTIGTICYDGSRTILKITCPLQQWMILTDSSTTIYYPDEGNVLEISSGSPPSLPFFNLFTGAMKETFGLPELGYTIQKNEMKNDTLFTYWASRHSERQSKGVIILGLVEDQIVCSESRHPDGQKAVKALFQNHISFQATSFPMKMILVRYTNEITITEMVEFANPVFNEPLPAEISGFTIPEGTVKEVLEW